MNNNVKAEFTNEDLGITSFVVRNDNDNFAVVLVDNDSGNTLPVVKIFKVESDAVDYAKLLVK